MERWTRRVSARIAASLVVVLALPGMASAQEASPDPPTVTITQHPPAETESTDATFIFEVEGSYDSINCGLRMPPSLERDSTSGCVSGQEDVYTNLFPGTWTYYVSACSEAGSCTEEQYTWRVTEPPKPSVVMASGPPTQTHDTSAMFSFTTSDTNDTTTIRCRVSHDAPTSGDYLPAFEPCSSPVGYGSFQPARHTFVVEVCNGPSNCSSASYQWDVLRLPLPAIGPQPTCAFRDTPLSSAHYSQIMMATVCLANYERVKRGIYPLYVDQRLALAAQGHAQDMVRRDFFNHTNPDGCDPACRGNAAGYPGFSAENISAGRPTPSTTILSWMNSPPHRENGILSQAWEVVGSGAAIGGQYGRVWSLHFGQLYPDAFTVHGLEPQYQGPADPTRIPTASWPAKLEVLRAGVKDGKLDVLADITARASGDKVKVQFHARGKKHRFTATVKDSRLRINRLLPRSQRSVRTGIVTLAYEGGQYKSAQVRPTEVRLRAASGKANLERGELSVERGVLSAAGTVSKSARGVVRLELTWDNAGGGVGSWEGRATIRDGKWKVEEELPAEAHGGGYLTMQFTGYLRRNMRGEQTAKQVLAE